jgi:hypothetical protein
VRSEKYAVMMTTSKSMAPIARRKKPKDGSGITALPLLRAFVIDLERQVDGLVPKQPRRKSQKAGFATRRHGAVPIWPKVTDIALQSNVRIRSEADIDRQPIAVEL